jgi:hypothetical protein
VYHPVADCDQAERIEVFTGLGQFVEDGLQCRGVVGYRPVTDSLDDPVCDHGAGSWFDNRVFHR